jgi:AraC family transcriptional regulator
LKVCLQLFAECGLAATYFGLPAWLREFETRFGVRRRKPCLAPWQERLAKQRLSSGIQRTVQIADIAGSCRLSKGHFVTAFTNTVGLSPYRWFTECRVGRAKQMLANSSLTLVEIALDCGFSDQSHFTKAFRRIAGTTPGVWRRRNSPRRGQE